MLLLRPLLAPARSPSAPVRPQTPRPSRRYPHHHRPRSHFPPHPHHPVVHPHSPAIRDLHKKYPTPNLISPKTHDTQVVKTLTGSYITRMTRLQLGHVAMSS